MANDSGSASVLPVVIVGGGLGGSAAAAFLARGGVDTMVLERHDRASSRPRAWIVSPRTLELLRELGIDDQVTTRGSAGAWQMVQTPTLVQVPAGEMPVDEGAAVSPTGSATCDQDILEDIIRSEAIRRGAVVRWASTVTGIVDRGEVVEVRTESGEPVRARYVIVAQGARADLLATLGVTTTKPEPVSDPSADFDQVLFRSSELDALMSRIPGTAFVCTTTGTMVFRRNLERWQIQRQGLPFENPVGDVAATVGRTVDIDVLDHSSWTPSAHCADSYRAGRVFLVGDVAHSFPPSLGMGGNLAIADAHNLAWKLARVLDGRAGDGLLDSYDRERRPLGSLVMHRSIGLAHGNRTLDLLTAQLGLGYPAGTSPALIGDGNDVTVTDPHNPRPLVGARLLHQWLPNGQSTIDLANIDTFAAVGAGVHDPMAVPYTQIPSLARFGDPDRVWLIRPDGHVAAHLNADEIPAALRTILDRTR